MLIKTRGRVQPFIWFVVSLALAAPAPAADAPSPSDLPVVQPSFYDLPDEAASLKSQKKTLAVYFWQNGCPYCAAFEKKVLTRPDVGKKLNAGFHLIEMNIFGDREVKDFGGAATSEKKFARAAGVQFTPTTIFYNHSGKEVFRMPGYWEPPHVMAALDYVAGGHYRTANFQDYLREVMTSQQAEGGANGENRE
ncbi:MAG: thioredoxin fold domain-containing protein [Nitrospinae bacterium]|nr:thioredoxin fold domain-containing protein [Nitrospinota bacterium]